MMRSLFFGVHLLVFSLIVLFVSMASSLFSQENTHFQAGYASLVIKISGDPPKTMDFSIPYASNPLSHERPHTFHTVNDSTLALSFFTFGSSPVFFRLNGRYMASVLLPNRSDVLHIHYADSADYTMDYQVF